MLFDAYSPVKKMENIKACATFVLLIIVDIGMVGTAAADPGITMEITPIAKCFPARPLHTK
ncbi:MAG: hypothetical protein OCU22_00665 [Canidatus Methanoxibalbensis ujae]|nr:hypothetical protein [Candidatus Methanoxibalbensis ujae]